MEKFRKDFELARAVVRKEAGAFDTLYGLYHSHIHGICKRIFNKDDSDFEDAVQDSLLMIYEKINQYRGESALSSWIYTVTSNAAFLKMRRDRKHRESRAYPFVTQDLTNLHGKESVVETFILEAIPTNDPERDPLLSDEICKAFWSLPIAYRRAAWAFYVQDLNPEDAAPKHNVSIPSHKSSKYRAKEMLRKALLVSRQEYERAA